MSWRLGQGQFHASRWASAPPSICSISLYIMFSYFYQNFYQKFPFHDVCSGSFSWHSWTRQCEIHIMIIMCTVCVPVRKFLPLLGSMSLGGNYHVTDATGSAFLKVGKPSVAGGIRGSNTTPRTQRILSSWACSKVAALAWATDCWPFSSIWR